jgi:hypothetical protein
MYYTSTNKADLEAYNDKVVWGENYDGVYTTDWAQVIEHPNGVDYAMLKHPNYDAELTLLETLSEDWFPSDII